MTRPGRSASTTSVGGIPRVAIGNDGLELDVPVRPDAVAHVRHAVVDELSRHQIPSSIVDDIELVASELVTNAIVHPPAAGPASVGVRVLVSDAIEVVVDNIGSTAAIPPVERWLPTTAPAPSGRGLAIVRRLCDEVTIRQIGARAVITCRRRLPDAGAMP